MEAIEKLSKQYQLPRQDMKNSEQKHSNRNRETAVQPQEEEYAILRQGWHDKFQDILQGVPERLPPLRAVNHEINLIDPKAKYTHQLP